MNAARLRVLCLFAVLIALGATACDKASDGAPAAGEEAAESAVATRPMKADPADWCSGHALPESMCTKCNPELIAGYVEAGDWCGEHGFPESACPQCNPLKPPPGQPAAAGGGHSADNGEWCKGHGLPESHCTKCHPELVDKFKAAGDWCAEHGFPESACPTCNPMPPPAADQGAEQGAIPGVPAGTTVRFKKADHEQAVGIETVAAREVPVGLGATAPARLAYDQDKVADVRAAVPGIVRKVEADLGQAVEKGDPLFVLESAKVGDLQGAIRSGREAVETARANFNRQKDLHAKGITPQRQLELARQELETAQSELSSLESALRLAGGGSTGTSGRYVLRAPISGQLVRRPAVVGAFATEETSLGTVADITTLWAMIDLAERDSFAVRLGQPVVLKIDGAPGEFTGEVTWIAPEVDPRTRTVQVRAEIDNADGRLRANQFAQATIGIAPDARGVVTPRASLQRLGEATVVFVRKDVGLYEPRLVEPGRASGEIVQVRGDLEVGEPVVTTGAFLLKTELSRDSIGAGCCEVGE